MDSNFISIFIEAAHRASLIPLASEATLYAMASFAETSILVPVIIAVVGGLLGHLFNMVLGYRLMRLPSSPTDKPFYIKLQQHWNRYGFVLLIFCFASLGNILSVIAGMLMTPWKKAVPMILIGLAYHYGQLLF